MRAEDYQEVGYLLILLRTLRLVREAEWDQPYIGFRSGAVSFPLEGEYRDIAVSLLKKEIRDVERQLIAFGVTLPADMAGADGVVA